MAVGIGRGALGFASLYKGGMNTQRSRLVASLRTAALAILMFMVAPVPSMMGADGFVDGIEDLPLMEGLVATDAGSLIFDSAAGRVVEAYAVGTIEAAAVTAFYGRSLPQLGWSQVGPTLFQREGEILSIEYLPPETAGGPLTVRFSLSPAEG